MSENEQAKTTKRTLPSHWRMGEWLAGPDDLEIRVAIQRGFDCREGCEHEPKRTDGTCGFSGDSWHFDVRIRDVGASLRCISHIRNGAIDSDSKVPIVGEELRLHRKVGPDEGEPCDVFVRCETSFVGYLFSVEFFEKAHVDTLLPFALRTVDAIDLAGVADAMGPLWTKMGIVVATAFFE